MACSHLARATPSRQECLWGICVWPMSRFTWQSKACLGVHHHRLVLLKISSRSEFFFPSSFWPLLCLFKFSLLFLVEIDGPLQPIKPLGRLCCQSGGWPLQWINLGMCISCDLNSETSKMVCLFSSFLFCFVCSSFHRNSSKLVAITFLCPECRKLSWSTIALPFAKSVCFNLSSVVVLALFAPYSLLSSDPFILYPPLFFLPFFLLLLSFQDFVGLNYYSHYLVKFVPDMKTPFRLLHPPGQLMTDMYGLFACLFVS